MSSGRWRELWSGPLAMLFLTFPGIFLPLDMIFVAPGIMAYATREQVAQIFLYSAALAFLMSVIACLVVAWMPRRVALTLCVTLSTLALLHGLLLWSQYFTYSPEYQWLRRAAVAALALTAGPVLPWLLRERHVVALHSVLRASTALVAIAALACGVLLAASLQGPVRAAAAAAPEAHDKPPIFMISVDTLSALYLPMYGYEQPTAPRLSEFARNATLFLRNYANSNLTTPSVNSMLHGTRPWTHRAVHLEGRPLPKTSTHSLPAILKAAGYYTASVSTNPWAAPRNLGIIEHFTAISENNLCAAGAPVAVLPQELQVAIKGSLVWKNVHSLLLYATDRLGLCVGHHFDPELAFAEARGILARVPAEQPLFLWVHLFPPHDPYVTPAPFVGMFAPADEARDRASTTPRYAYEAVLRIDFPGLLRFRYQEAIRYVDHHIGAFLDELKRTGFYERSLIVITADHGESFSKSYGGHGGPGLHEELVRVPLLIKEPGQADGRVLNQLSEQVDLLPTLLELAEIDERPRTEGISLVPALRGEPLERSVFSMNFQQSPRLGPLETGTVAMVRGRWKYVHYFGNTYYPFMPQLKDALYDLAADPHETRNQIATYGELARLMREEIKARLRRHAGPIE